MSDVDLKDAALIAAGVGGAFLLGPAAISAVSGAGAGAGGAAGTAIPAAGAVASPVLPAAPTAAQAALAGTSAFSPVAPASAAATLAGPAAPGSSVAGTVSATAGIRSAAGRVFQSAEDTVGAVGAAATIGGGVLSVEQQAEAAREARRARRTQQAVQDITNRRARLRTLEQGRILQSEAQARGVAQGAGQGTSTVQGTVASIGTQTAGAVGANLLRERAGRTIFDAESGAIRAGNRAGIFGAIGNEGTRLTGQNTVDSIFDLASRVV
jgi:hypothetical protein